MIMTCDLLGMRMIVTGFVIVGVTVVVVVDTTTDTDTIVVVL